MQSNDATEAGVGGDWRERGVCVCVGGGGGGHETSPSRSRATLASSGGDNAALWLDNLDVLHTHCLSTSE